MASYTRAIRDWVDESGEGIASPYFSWNKPMIMKKLLSTLQENADNDVMS